MVGAALAQLEPYPSIASSGLCPRAEAMGKPPAWLGPRSRGKQRAVSASAAAQAPIGKGSRGRRCSGSKAPPLLVAAASPHWWLKQAGLAVPAKERSLAGEVLEASGIGYRQLPFFWAVVFPGSDPLGTAGQMKIPKAVLASACLS